jgi:hypothetical protein
MSVEIVESDRHPRRDSVLSANTDLAPTGYSPSRVLELQINWFWANHC